MALGRRPEERQQEFWIATGDLPKSAGHPFYQRLEQLLVQGNFDEFAEDLCEPYYAEGIDSQRGIAWRCSDSLSLRGFLGLEPKQNSPDHSSLTKIRQRLPLAVHEQVFTFVLELAAQQGLLRGRTVAVDATTLEANAAMKSIVRKETGEDWKEYLRRLAEVYHATEAERLQPGVGVQLLQVLVGHREHSAGAAGRVEKPLM